MDKELIRAMKQGKLVRYWRRRGGWATARFVRVVESGRKFGLWDLRPTCELNGKKVCIRPEDVKNEEMPCADSIQD
jgi:muconolactone delta-isomerase